MSSPDCPKCQGPRDAKSLYCPFCGVIFARYTGAEAAPAPPLRASRPAPAEAAEKGAAFPAPAAPAAAPAAAEAVYGGALSAEAEAAWNPYTGPRSAPIASQRSPLLPDYELASPSSRLVAHMLNGLGFLGMVLLCALPGILVILASSPENPAGVACLVFGIAIGSCIWLISNLRQLSRTGQSLGKKWMDIRILKTNGEQASVGHLVFLRYLSMQALGAVPYAGPVVGLVDALMVFTAERRCLHDHIAGTMVVKA